MKHIRTKQQVACDGVKTAWHDDTFTEILHQQVTTQFFMDGVIPSEEVSEPKRIASAQTKEQTLSEKISNKKPAGVFIGVMEGIRLPWKEKYSTT